MAGAERNETWRLNHIGSAIVTGPEGNEQPVARYPGNLAYIDVAAYERWLGHAAWICGVHNGEARGAAREVARQLAELHDRLWSQPLDGVPAHRAGERPDQCSACAALRTWKQLDETGSPVQPLA